MQLERFHFDLVKSENSLTFYSYSGLAEKSSLLIIAFFTGL